MKSLLTVLFSLFAFPLIALAQVATPAATPGIIIPVDPNAVVGMFPTLLTFFQNGQYLALGGAITLILCFVLNKYVLPKIGLGSAVVPIASTIVGILSGLGLAVANGASPLAAALAVMSGPLATHAYELFFQYFVPKDVPTATSVAVKKAA
jgi:hypothetical protein